MEPIALELKPRYYPVSSYLIMSLFLLGMLASHPEQFRTTIVLVILISCFCYFLLVFVLLAFVRPGRIRVDVQGTLHYAPILGRWRTVHRKAIGFSYTPERYKLTIGVYPGLIVYLMGGSILELNGLASENPDMIARYLRKSGVKSLGHESSWFPFRKLKYRFNRTAE